MEKGTKEITQKLGLGRLLEGTFFFFLKGD